MAHQNCELATQLSFQASLLRLLENTHPASNPKRREGAREVAEAVESLAETIPHRHGAEPPAR